MKSWNCMKKTVVFSEEDYENMGWIFEQNIDYRNDRWNWAEDVFYTKTVMFPDGTRVEIDFCFKPYGDRDICRDDMSFVRMEFFFGDMDGEDVLECDPKYAIDEWETDYNGTLYVIELTDKFCNFDKENSKFFVRKSA